MKYLQKKYLFSLAGIILIAIATYFSYTYFFADFKINTFPQEPPFAMPTFEKLNLPDKQCNIADFGAKQDDNFLNTEAFKKAISECSESGGGQVVIPDGKWLTGAIHLKSNIDLHLERNATILFSKNQEDYLPQVFTRFEGMELMNYSPFIYANACENVSISGEGTIDGQGENWLKWKDIQKGDAQRLYKMAMGNVPVEDRVFAKKGDALRPFFVEFVNCKNVRLLDFKLKNSPMWSIHPLYSENVLIRGIEIITDGHNTDGIVIDSSRNVLVDDVDLETGDDSISIKSGVDADGWRVNRPTENVVIRNSRMKNGHSSIAIGSEMSGGVKNVYIQDCSFSDADQGVRVKSMPGRGGYVENIWVRDLKMDNIVNASIQFELNYDSSTNTPETTALPKVKNIFVQDIKVSEDAPKYLIKIDGLPDELIENINISNLEAKSEKGIFISNAKQVNLENITFKAKKKPYFQFTNVKDLEMKNATCKKNDAECVLFK